LGRSCWEIQVVISEKACSFSEFFGAILGLIRVDVLCVAQDRHPVRGQRNEYRRWDSRLIGVSPSTISTHMRCLGAKQEQQINEAAT